MRRPLFSRGRKFWDMILRISKRKRFCSKADVEEKSFDISYTPLNLKKGRLEKALFKLIEEPPAQVPT
ncbi:hypothetical protein L6452_17925 [Arctium lappa]|uniref:Uncharacterized protein n=1 Tax=Arctium lappa TaxID=4217 RepID=A0ACB9C4L3_ARCLA|nr:hypothetical protein L6452_17925 [Arctium lappa]